MTTTVVRDSIVGDQWIQQTAQAVPIQRVIDEKTGEVTADILTGPVRLAFDNLFELPQATPQMPNPKYGAALLFTPYADFSLLYEEYYNVCAREFAEYYDAATQQYYGLHSPFRDQSEKLKFGGFTPGCVFMTCTSKFKPPVVDARRNPIVDPSKVYPGVWAVCAISSYAYKDPRKKGVGFGLQSVMIIGDDNKFGGGAPDPNKTFGGVSVNAPIVRPEQMAGMPTGGAPQAQPGIPGYTQPGFTQPSVAPGPALSAQTLGVSATASPSNVPQAQPYTPPQMPGQPVPPVADDDDNSFMG